MNSSIVFVSLINFFETKVDQLNDIYNEYKNKSLRELENDNLLDGIIEIRELLKKYNEAYNILKKYEGLFFMPLRIDSTEHQKNYLEFQKNKTLEDFKATSLYKSIMKNILDAIEVEEDDKYRYLYAKKNGDCSENEKILYELMIEYLNKTKRSYHDDKVAFSIEDNKPMEGNYFICDSPIVETIKILREKGYNTSEGCSGHVDEYGAQASSIYEEEVELIGNIEEQIKNFIYTKWQKGDIVKIENYEVQDKKLKIFFNCIWDNYRTYIFFRGNNLSEENVPKGFEVKNYGDCSTIERRYAKKYEVNGVMIDRPLKDIEKEKKEANQSLLEWAKGLQKYDEMGYKTK